MEDRRRNHTYSLLLDSVSFTLPPSTLDFTFGVTRPPVVYTARTMANPFKESLLVLTQILFKKVDGLEPELGRGLKHLPSVERNVQSSGIMSVRITVPKGIHLFSESELLLLALGFPVESIHPVSENKDDRKGFIILNDTPLKYSDDPAFFGADPVSGRDVVADQQFYKKLTEQYSEDQLEHLAAGFNFGWLVDGLTESSTIKVDTLDKTTAELVSAMDQGLQDFCDSVNIASRMTFKLDGKKLRLAPRIKTKFKKLHFSMSLSVDKMNSGGLKWANKKLDITREKSFTSTEVADIANKQSNSHVTVESGYPIILVSPQQGSNVWFDIENTPETGRFLNAVACLDKNDRILRRHRLDLPLTPDDDFCFTLTLLDRFGNRIRLKEDVLIHTVFSISS